MIVLMVRKRKVLTRRHGDARVVTVVCKREMFRVYRHELDIELGSALLVGGLEREGNGITWIILVLNLQGIVVVATSHHLKLVNVK